MRSLQRENEFVDVRVHHSEECSVREVHMDLKYLQILIIKFSFAALLLRLILVLPLSYRVRAEEVDTLCAALVTLPPRVGNFIPHRTFPWTFYSSILSRNKR